MKLTKKVLSVLLAALMLLPLLAGCGSTAEQTGTDTTAQTEAGTADTTAAPETTVEETTLRSQVKDGVPDSLKFDGTKVRVLHRNDNTIGKYDVYGTENAGDYVLDSAWMRNMNIEDRLDIVFDFVPCDTGSGTGDTYNFIVSLVMSDSDEFDYILTTGNTNVSKNMNQYLRDLSSLPYADYDAPWWWRGCMEAVSLDGKTYNYIYGDALIYSILQVSCVYFNKTLFEKVYGTDPDSM